MEGEGVIHYGPGAATEGVTPVNAEGKKKRRRPKKHGRESPRDIGGKKAIVGSMTVSLAGPNGSVMGGVLAGSLIAAAPVQGRLGIITDQNFCAHQVVITSFRPSNEEPKQFAPTSSLVPATGDGETRGAKTG
uniref:AT-hook motif nuclear-localized protein n=1 Tax=Daucus carota subsp. sativus TaxID=79200 RepID=A0A165XCB7_DAUCS